MELMATTRERTDTLARARKRLSFLVKARPYYKQTIKDTRIIIDALESLILLDMKGDRKNVKENH